MKISLSTLLWGMASLAVLLQPACRGIESDALYARYLPGPPDDLDWKVAVPLRVMASGGRVHQDLKPLSAQEVDQDTVHRNSASCHHGPAMKTDFPVWLRAYHDQANLYIRVSWPDLTKDAGERQWVRKDGSWKLEGEEGDGISLVFPMDRPVSFDCSLVCHLDDWTMADGRFQESAGMRYDREAVADLWLWRAEKEEAWDLYIDDKGIHPDSGPETHRIKNSRIVFSPGASVIKENLAFSSKDAPYAKADGSALKDDFNPEEGMKLPAYLSLPPDGEISNINAIEYYRRGLWEVTLIRPMDTGDSHDIALSPGNTYFFGLSVMDDTQRDHHLVDSASRLIIMRRDSNEKS